MEGKGFYDDLAAFRRKKEQISRLCLTNGTRLQRQYRDKYVKAVSLKQNLMAESREQCERMATSENSYLAYLRGKRFKTVGKTEAKSISLLFVCLFACLVVYFVYYRNFPTHSFVV